MKDIDYYNLKEQAINKIKKQNKKLLKKISKKILKQVKQNPMQNYYEINIDKYSLEDMRIIKRYFCDWLGFGFSTEIPNDEFITTINYVTSVESFHTISANNNTVKVKPLTKFYITWFQKN